MDAITKVSNGTRMLAEAKTFFDAMDISDAAEAYRYALKMSGASREAVNEAGALKQRAERKAGEILREMPKDEGGRPKRNQSEAATSLPTLAEQGIDRHVAARCQKIAEIPEEQFEEYLATAEEITTAGTLRLATWIGSDPGKKDTMERIIIRNPTNIIMEIKQVFGDKYEW